MNTDMANKKRKTVCRAHEKENALRRETAVEIRRYAACGMQ